MYDEKLLFTIMILFFAIQIKAQYQSVLGDTTISWNIYNTNFWHSVEDRIDTILLFNKLKVNGLKYRE